MAVKILVVEDDILTAKALAAFLGSKGLEVVCASDGEEGLEMAVKAHPAVILLDLILPRLSGFDVLKRLKSDTRTKSIPVVAVTALGKMGDVEQAFSCGADDYVIKPFNNERLLAKIEKFSEKAEWGNP